MTWILASLCVHFPGFCIVENPLKCRMMFTISAMLLFWSFSLYVLQLLGELWAMTNYVLNYIITTCTNTLPLLPSNYSTHEYCLFKETKYKKYNIHYCLAVRITHWQESISVLGFDVSSCTAITRCMETYVAWSTLCNELNLTILANDTSLTCNQHITCSNYTPITLV